MPERSGGEWARDDDLTIAILRCCQVLLVEVRLMINHLLVANHNTWSPVLGEIPACRGCPFDSRPVCPRLLTGLIGLESQRIIPPLKVRVGNGRFKSSSGNYDLTAVSLYDGKPICCIKH